MASSESKPGSGAAFTVTDRRSFTDDGRPKDNEVVEPAPAPASGPAAPMPAIDFHTFVVSLGSSALLHLGELDHPETGKPQKDLALAKNTIDILSMLRDKTKGNLTAAEDSLIESLLFDLRLRYVDASKR